MSVLDSAIVYIKNKKPDFSASILIECGFPEFNLNVKCNHVFYRGNIIGDDYYFLGGSDLMSKKERIK